MIRRIKSSETISDPIYLNYPFPALIQDGIVDKNQCIKIIEDTMPLIKKHSIFMHHGRNAVNNSSVELQKLISKSKHWQKFIDLLSNNYTKNFIKHFRKKSENKFVRNWLKNKKIILNKSVYNLRSNLLKKKFKKLNKKIDIWQKNRVSNLSDLAVFSMGIYSLSNLIYRKFRSLLDFILGIRKLSLLLDYSVSFDGYFREIHRDSDSRAIVFLVFLNELENDAKGGTFSLYSHNLGESNLPARPKKKNSELTHLIEPKAGRMIMFFNVADAYHSVERLKNTKLGNHFIYGGFTLSSNLGALAKKGSNEAMNTEFNLYR